MEGDGAMRLHIAYDLVESKISPVDHVTSSFILEQGPRFFGIRVVAGIIDLISVIGTSHDEFLDCLYDLC